MIAIVVTTCAIAVDSMPSVASSQIDDGHNTPMMCSNFSEVGCFQTVCAANQAAGGTRPPAAATNRTRFNGERDASISCLRIASFCPRCYGA